MARLLMLVALNVVFASSLHVATVDCPFGYGTNCGGGGKLDSATKAQVGAILEGILKNLSSHSSLVASKVSVQKVASPEMPKEPAMSAPVKAAMASLVSTMRKNGQQAAADVVDCPFGYGTNCGGGGKLSSATKAQVGAILEGILKNLSNHK